MDVDGELLSWLALSVPLAYVSGFLVALVWDTVMKWLEQQRERRRARLEAELDRKQAELRQTILRLSAELSGDAHEARKALIRESFLARGEIPDD